MRDRILNSKFIKRISGWKISRFLCSHPFFGKFFNYEFISYVFFGVLTTLLDYAVYFIIPHFGTTGFDIVVKNVVAWIVAVIFAYFVNKLFVFDSPSWKKNVVTREFIIFTSSRLISLGMETLILYLTVEVMAWPEVLCKIGVGILVMLMNYFAGKYLVFLKKKKKKETPIEYK